MDEQGPDGREVDSAVEVPLPRAAGWERGARPAAVAVTVRLGEAEVIKDPPPRSEAEAG